MAFVRSVLRSLVGIMVLPVTILQYIGFWDPLYKRFFPYLMRRMTTTINDKMDKVKKELFGRLPDFASSSGLTVLEVGCGTGANFQYYPWGCKVICTDPNPNFEHMLKSSGAKNTHLKLERFVVACGENLSQVASGSVDAVVCTFVLCTAQNVDAVLKEIKRVLRPGGAFFFIEHVAADKETWLHFIQHVIQPAWRYFGDGCYLTRDTSANLEKANFSELNLKHIIAPLMSLIKHHIVGYAVK
ncbi:methyltransferase-like protein 7A [Chiloscyllium plagiosum]|uniref:methyltransferase-like protein 7A n=1 Tax=Chiloscyllium plagiosum TaxID=36176 RepID=UPI001CB7C693|nr:methyltransferase-like protein 7A [Chiloscyllium plagiosum]